MVTRPVGIILPMVTGSGREELLERNGQCFYLRGDGLECIHGWSLQRHDIVAV